MTTSYDDYLDACWARRYAEDEAYEAWCSAMGYDPEDDHEAEWESVKYAEEDPDVARDRYIDSLED